MEPPTPSGTEQPMQHTHSIKHHADKSKYFINEMKKPMEGLTATLDVLHGQTMQIALLGDVGTKHEISELRQQILDQDRKHKECVTEIQTILDDLLEKEVVRDMRKQVEQEIAEQIDELVKEQVAECLKVHISQDLQDEVARSKRELEELNLALHNSESRRANGNLRANKADDLLATLFMPDGTLSPRFPKDLNALFSLDGTTLTALMDDYKLPNPSNSRDHNLNRFMQFCGVRYQLVRRPGAEKH